MNLKPLMAISRIDSPRRLTVAYAVFGTFWIVGSDVLEAWWDGDRSGLWLLGTAKSMLFIAVTTGLLHLLVRRMVRQHNAVEQALRLSQERLSLALVSANQGLYDLNVQTGETVVNDTYATMLGYDPAIFRETNAAWRDRLNPDDRDRVYQNYSDYVAGKIDHYHVEFRQRTATGDWRWVLSVGRIVERDELGRPKRMLGTHTDITSRKSSETRAQDALALMKAMIHHSPVGIIVYATDGQAVIANGAAARMVGTEVTVLLRQNFHELESWRKYGLLAAAEQAIASGRGVAHSGRLETTFGRSIWIEARFVPFEHEGSRHLLLIMSDETDKHAAFDRLQLMHAAVVAAPVGWVVTDAGGTIEWVNPGFTTLTGYSPEEVIGRNPRVLKSGRHAPEFYGTMWATIKRGEVWSGEMFNQRKDGRQYHEFMTIAPVRDEEGAIRHFVAIKLDITEQKSLENQLARAQRLESIGMLASGIAHDLNNIFAPILLSIELLKMKYPTSDAKKMLELIETAGQRGAGIVRQVLTFARGIDGERAVIQPKYLLKELAQILGQTLPREITVQSELARDLSTVCGDTNQLHQVILNLAINARDAMPHGGTLTLKACDVAVDAAWVSRNPMLKPGPYVALGVADSGTGIAPEVLENMFDPFFTTKPRGKGTGLGLSTVYGIVRSHGGVVEVKTQLGRGTEFTVLLPASSKPEVRHDSNPPMAAPFTGAGRRVLVVDDEESIRLVILHTLQRHGFVVEVAVDGAEALAIFRAHPGRFVAVLTDMMMPNMNGAELAREIRRLSPGLPIVAMTGISSVHSIGSMETILRALGIQTILQKPCTETELLAALQRELEPGPAASPGKND